jgi:hypothetical protein
MKLAVFGERFAVCKVATVGAEGEAAREALRLGGRFTAWVRTSDELSLVCEERCAPPGARVEGGWRLLRVSGTLDFSQIGVLAALCVPLAEAGVSIFAVSTFDTDYLMFKHDDLARATASLEAAGHDVELAPPAAI